MLYWAVGCLIMLIVLLVLLWKLYWLRRAIKEIREGFVRHLNSDSNVLIDVSSGDREVRQLAATINSQLRLLRQERRRFQQGDQELKDAITGISHDLRTPLTAILGYLDLTDSTEKTPEMTRYLSQIRNRAESMRGLTEELFRYSVVTASQPLDLCPVELGRALEEALLSFYGVMEQRNIQPRITLPEEKVVRTLDPSALGRILSNIISNAMKYSSGDLSVALDASGCFRFSNHAPGLTPVTVGRLFDRFYTVESNRNSTGLGLSIARHLTEQLGGTITAELQGELFTITLRFPQ